MKYYSYIQIILFFLGAGCTKPVVEEETPVTAKVEVEVSGIKSGLIKDELTLFATTKYLKRNVVQSPIPAYVTDVTIKLGDKVAKGQLLYSLETKERRALGPQKVLSDSINENFGIIKMNAPVSGIITNLDVQQTGDYILEGSRLCTISESSSLMFDVNVPFEYIDFTRGGKKCTLLLPDNSQYQAKFTTPLTTMNAASQTQIIMAKADQQLFLPENLIVKVLVNKNSNELDQILPKTAILSDEMMQRFWVMKLLNDTTAIKVDVTPGTMNNESVEIVEPHFNTEDQFLISGNYGLPDTALVTVIHSPEQ